MTVMGPQKCIHCGVPVAVAAADVAVIALGKAPDADKMLEELHNIWPWPGLRGNPARDWSFVRDASDAQIEKWWNKAVKPNRAVAWQHIGATHCLTPEPETLPEGMVRTPEGELVEAVRVKGGIKGIDAMIEQMLNGGVQQDPEVLKRRAEAEARRAEIDAQYPVGPGEVEMVATCTRKFECSQSIIRNQTLNYEFKPGDTVPARKGWGRMQGTPVEQWYLLVDEHLAEPFDWFGIPADNAEAFFTFAPKPRPVVKKLGRKRIIIED